MNAFEMGLVRQIEMKMLRLTKRAPPAGASKKISTQNILRQFTPSLQMQVHLQGRKVAELKLGQKYKYYDLASLTKIIFTASTLMELVDQKKINLKDKISRHLPWWPYKAMPIHDVLSHSAGLSWWAPFYKEWLKNKKAVSKRRYLTREQVKRILLSTAVDESPRARRKALYSDLDIILMGFLIEEVSGKGLHEAWLSSKVKAKIQGLHFNLNNKPKYARSLYAPTERCPWRHKVLRGEVHDDNTWSFGGISTHAGLFGTIDDVAQFGLLLRQAYRQRPGGYLAKNKTIKKFTQRAIPRARGDWALSFMLPTKG